MSGQIGAELGQMQNLKKTFDQSTAKTNELKSAITNTLHNTWWKGPAADRFQQAWNNEFAPALQKLADALNEAAAEVQRRHDALQAAGS
ncbi:MAG: WXG100 family type VII secretion target [Ilumatobacteraceae bacterium]